VPNRRAGDRASGAAGSRDQRMLPAVTAARTIYHGSYESLPAAWSELNAWIKAPDRGTLIVANVRDRSERAQGSGNMAHGVDAPADNMCSHLFVCSWTVVRFLP
jgi:hypothetical protein